MVQINSLYSLENVRPYYFINDKHEIINTLKDRKLKVWTSVRGYQMVTLQADKRKRGINVPLHKLVALACINNGPYELIEHLDDDKFNNRIENLKFSDQSSNMKSAFRNKRIVRKERVFKLTMISGEERIGTMKELSSASGISRATLYDRLYKERNPLFNGKPKTSRNKILAIQELSK